MTRDSYTIQQNNKRITQIYVYTYKLLFDHIDTSFCFNLYYKFEVKAGFIGTFEFGYKSIEERGLNERMNNQISDIPS